MISGKMIETFQATCFSIGCDINNYSYHTKRARTMDANCTPEEISKILEEDTQWEGVRIDYLTGKEYSPKALIRHCHREYKKRRDEVIYDKTQPGNFFHYFLNNQKGNSYARIIQRNLNLAILKTSEEIDYTSRTRSLYILNNLKVSKEAWAVYGSCENSDRLFAHGITPHLLPREIRNVLFTGCWEIDLEHAQWSIASKVLGLPKAEALFRADIPIWKYMCQELGVEEEKYKQTIKVCVYSLLYGMTRENLKEKLTFGDISANILPMDADKVLANSLLQELIQACENCQRRMKHGILYYDAWNREIRPLKKENGAACAMAVMMQSYEMRIVAAGLLKFEKYQSTVKIMLHLHDGLIIYLNDNSKSWKLKAIVEEMNKEARALGVTTKVTYKRMDAESEVGDIEDNNNKDIEIGNSLSPFVESIEIKHLEIVPQLGIKENTMDDFEIVDYAKIKWAEYKIAKNLPPMPEEGILDYLTTPYFEEFCTKYQFTKPLKEVLTIIRDYYTVEDFGTYKGVNEAWIWEQMSYINDPDLDFTRTMKKQPKTYKTQNLDDINTRKALVSSWDGYRKTFSVPNIGDGCILNYLRSEHLAKYISYFEPKITVEDFKKKIKDLYAR